MIYNYENKNSPSQTGLRGDSEAPWLEEEEEEEDREGEEEEEEEEEEEIWPLLDFQSKLWMRCTLVHDDARALLLQVNKHHSEVPAQQILIGLQLQEIPV